MKEYSLPFDMKGQTDLIDDTKTILFPSLRWLAEINLDLESEERAMFRLIRESEYQRLKMAVGEAEAICPECKGIGRSSMFGTVINCPECVEELED